MNTLILISLGIATALLVSKPRYQKYWDIIIGILGTLAASAIIGYLEVPIAITPQFKFLMPILGAVIAIHIARFLEDFSISSFININKTS